MRVLWFTNTPSLAEEKLGKKSVAGGWIKSLENHLTNNTDIELGICFFSNRDIKPFSTERTKYYPIYKRTSSKFMKVMNIYLNIESYRIYHEQFMGVIGDFSPDLVHIHGSEEVFGSLVNYADIPIVLSIQGNLTVYSNMFFRGISKEDIIRYQPLINELGINSYMKTSKKFIRNAYRERQFLRKFKYIIGRTSWDRRISKVLSPKARYFHNDEILRAKFYENKWNKKRSDVFVIHSTSGKDLYKGLETIVETALLLVEKNDFNFIWNVAGISYKDSIVKILRKKYPNKKAFSKIQFLGKLQEEELVEKLMKSDLYVMPSHIENSPNNLCEAMICGLPSIATFAGGSGSLMRDQKEGILVQDGDPWVMAGAILEVQEDENLAKNLGVNARKIALARHNPNKIVTDLIDIYTQILNTHTVID